MNKEQQPPEIDGKKGVVAESEPMDIDANTAKADAREKESVIVETLHTMHPNDVVFLSQLDPIPVAEVTDGYPVKDAEMLEHSMVYQAYCDQLNDINCKSVSMYNWMLHSQEQPLCDLTKSTDKLLSTRDWDAVRDEIIRVRVMERIEELKDKGKWSFLQPRKHRAPPRNKAHWDYLLDEMTWMHTDFAEERKLRVAMARMISSWVMDYHHARDKSLYIVSAKKHTIPDYTIRDAPEAGGDGAVPTAEMNDLSVHEGQTEPAVIEVTGASGQSKPEEHADYEPASVKEEDHSTERKPEASQSTDLGTPRAAKDTISTTSPLLGIDSLEAQPEAMLEAPASALKAEEPLRDIQGGVDDSVQIQRSSVPNTPEDHVVPSSSGYIDGNASVYQILAHLSQHEDIEEILGDSLYAMQSLSTLRPYGPAWDESYCDILDASPVVPICKTMWPDFGFDEEDDEFIADANSQDSIHAHDLVRLATDESSGWLGMESESQGARSIFTRNMMAPPLLPMFTQANKPPRNVHGSTNQPPADNPAQQSANDACPGQTVFEWSSDRDKTLAKIIQQYTGNWPLITESFNHAFSLY
ncbi:chromatin modification- protein VID21, partial [Coemansia erecta]